MEKTDESPTRKKRVKMISVKVIRTDNKSTLIETAVKGKYNRIVIPTGEIKRGKVSEDILRAGIPYGIPWEDFELIPPDLSEFSNELRRNGIYTADDFRNNQNVAFVILQKILGATRADLRKFVLSFKQEA